MITEPPYTPYTIKEPPDWPEVRRLAQRLGIPNKASNELDFRLANGEVYSAVAMMHALLDRMEALVKRMDEGGE